MSFKRLDPEDFLISADSITAGAWSENSPTLTAFYTSSIQENSVSGQYYLNVYQTASLDTTADVQFNLAYADQSGSGSAPYDGGIVGKSPTSTIYGQWQNIVLGDENSNFVFGGTTPTKQNLAIISVNRSKYKGNLLPGTMTLTLNDGSNTLELTDNSRDVSSISFNEAGRVFQMLSGSAGITEGTTTSFGLFLPDIGAIILSGDQLETELTNLTWSDAVDGSANNNQTFFNLISNGSLFTLNSQESITSDYVFVRARNSEYNYSENPSFISGSTGEVIYDDFINAPQTFITTVGMYNDNNELLAVAKLSKPLKKDFTKEALIRVKLDF